jgi:hypothetical protein
MDYKIPQPGAYCCERFETAIGEGRIELCDDPFRWDAPGCCGGGCNILSDATHCPYCGTRLGDSATASETESEPELSSPTSAAEPRAETLPDTTQAVLEYAMREGILPSEAQQRLAHTTLGEHYARGGELPARIFSAERDPCESFSPRAATLGLMTQTEATRIGKLILSFIDAPDEPFERPQS